MEPPSDSMPAPSAGAPPDAAASRPLPRRPRTAAAWIVIALVVAGAAATRWIPGPVEHGEDPLAALLFRLQARYLVGTARVLGAGERVWEQARQLESGPIAQRQRFVALAAELAGPEAAGRAVLELEALIDAQPAGPAAVTPDADERRLNALYRRLYVGADGEPLERPAHLAQLRALEPEARAWLAQHLGWLSGAVLAPEGSDEPALRERFLAAAQRTTFAILAGAAALGLAGLAGLGGLVVLVVRLARRDLTLRFEPGRAPHGIYAETFAVWMILFLALQLTAGLVMAIEPRAALVALGIGFALSLAALAWPVRRGVAWSVVRRDVGLVVGSARAREVLVGIGGYLLTLPLLAAGLVTSVLLLLLERALRGPGAPLESPATPTHPIAERLVQGDPWTVAQVFVLASVAAPIVEETMFRGVLYRHLRDATAKLGRLKSVLLAGLLDAFVFAAVHPQGWVAIPALMALAGSFVLLREWRGSLLPAMIVHGISNGIVLSALLFLTRA